MAYSWRELKRDVSQRNTPLQRQIDGWLWRLRHTRARDAAHPPQDALRAVFAIPLISKQGADDWNVVQKNLNATLFTLRRQDNPNWIALICGQDRPEQVTFDDRVRFVPFPEHPPGFDKHQKSEFLRDYIARDIGGAGYYFPFDADDLLHPGVVAHMLADNNRAGYQIERGYMLDHASLELATLQPPDDAFPEATHFYRSCGSSSAIYFDFDSGADYHAVIGTRGNHRKVVRNMAYLGFDIAQIPFHAAIYVMNHGDNLRQKRGKMSGKMKHFEVSPIRDTTRRAEIAEAFGLTEIFAGRWNDAASPRNDG